MMTGRTSSSATKRNRKPGKSPGPKIAKGTPGSQERPIQLSDDDNSTSTSLITNFFSPNRCSETGTDPPQKAFGARKKTKTSTGGAVVKSSPGQENRLNGKDARRRVGAKGGRSGRTRNVTSSAQPKVEVLDICTSSEEDIGDPVDPSQSATAKSSGKKRDRKEQLDDGKTIDSDVEIVEVDSKGKGSHPSKSFRDSKRQRGDGKDGSRSFGAPSTYGKPSLRASSLGWKPSLKASPVGEKPFSGVLSAGGRSSLAASSGGERLSLGASSVGKRASLGASSAGKRQSLGATPQASRLSLGASPVTGTPSLPVQSLGSVSAGGRLSRGAVSNTSTPRRKQPRSTRRRRKTAPTLARGSRSIESFLRSPISLNTSPRNTASAISPAFRGTPGSATDVSPSQQNTKPLAGASLDLSAAGVGVARSSASSLGLVRVENAKEYSTAIPAGATPCPLFPKAILGRTDSTSPASASANNKVDLGIDNNADGVSRRQLRVAAIRADHVVLKLFIKAPPTVRGFHFESKEDGVTHFVMKKHKDPEKMFRMNIGDVLQMDNYTRKDGSGARHMFRLVRVGGQLPNGLGAVVSNTPNKALAGRGKVATPQHLIARKQQAAPQSDSRTPTKLPAARCGMPHSTQPKSTPPSTSPESPAPIKPPSKEMRTQKAKSVEALRKVKDLLQDAKGSLVDRALRDANRTAPRRGGDTLSSGEKMKPVISLTDEEDSDKEDGNISIEDPPKVGDAIRQDFEVIDMFGNTVKEWYFGTALTVKHMAKSNPPRYLISLKWDDGTTENVEYPDADLLKLPLGCDESCTYDPNPQQLYIGDLVDCRSQDGKYRGSWYRGRVAKISADGKTFDVVYYDDGVWETGIPLQKGNVHLISRGSFPAKWLLGLVFEEPQKQKTQNRNGKVCGLGGLKGTDGGVPTTNRLDFSRNERTRLSVQYSDGTVEAISYMAVASKVFSTYRKRLAKNKFKRWPGSSSGLGEDAAKPKCDSNQGNVVSPFFSDDEDDSDSQEDGDAVNMSQEDTQESFPEKPFASSNRKEKVKEIHTSLAHMFWRALNSAEAHVGTGLLQHNLLVHKQVPAASLREDLLDFLKNGPKSEGISLRDPNRTELTGVYINSLLAMTQDGDFDMESVPSMGFSSWEDVELILFKPVHGEEMKKVLVSPLSQTLFRRMTHSLQLAAWGLCCTRKMFQSQLNEAVEENEGLEKCEGITVCAVRRHGMREALKLAVRAAAQCWLFYGPWAVAGSQDGESSELFFASEAQKCLAELGKIVCYFAWMFCNEENISIGANLCSFAIRDSFLSVLEGLQTDTSGGKSRTIPNAENFENRLKLQFVLSLTEEFAAPLQPVLAKMLGVDTAWSIISE